MTEQNTDAIFRIARQFDVKIPAEVTAAERVLDAAEKLRSDVAAEAAPDYTTATTKNLAKLHQAGVDWERRTERLKVADEIVTTAQAALDQAMFVSGFQLHEPLAAVFTTEAEAFIKALSDLGGTVDVAIAAVDPVKAEALSRLRTAESNLDQLKMARDAFAFIGTRAKTFSDGFEALSRTLGVTNRRAWELTSRHPGWLRALELGMAIKWQRPAEQEADAASILSQSRTPAQAGR